LKGVFFHKLGYFAENRQFYFDKAEEAFSSAIRISDNIGKAWAYWGNYCDQMMKEKPNPKDAIALASHAIHCYLRACDERKRSRKVDSKYFKLFILFIN